MTVARGRRMLFDGSTAAGLSKPWLIRAGLAASRDRCKTPLAPKAHPLLLPLLG